MNQELIAAKAILKNTGVSVADAARVVRNLLDLRSKECPLSPLQFCAKAVQTCGTHMRTAEMPLQTGLRAYIATKAHLRADSRRDIRYLSRRLLKDDPRRGALFFSAFTPALCERWLAHAFTTPSQFNKGRAMLHALFQFALRREWCDRNPVKLVARRKVVEREIRPLSFAQVRRLLRVAKRHGCVAPVALLALAGIRPREVRRLRWGDIDLKEKAVTVPSFCSKTGGARQVEISPALACLLRNRRGNAAQLICPPDWRRLWKRVRDCAGFCGTWVRDVLRHTYASFHAKRYRNLPRLQLEMGHADADLLRARYVNLRDIPQVDSRLYFFRACA